MVNKYLNLKKKNFKLVNDSWLNNYPVNLGLPIRMTLNTSYNCNLRCIMCQFHRKPEITKKLYRERKELPKEIFLDFADETFPTAFEIETTTVGEPVLSSYFDLINEKADQYGVKLYVTSNGTLITDQWLEKIFPNLGNLIISIDAVDPEIYLSIRKGSDYEKLMNGIKTFLELRKNKIFSRPKLTLQMTLMKKNINELPKMIEFAKEIGADNVKAYHAYIYDKEFLDQSLFFNQEITNKILFKAELLGKKLNIDTVLPKPFNISPNSQNISQHQSNLNFRKPPCLFLWQEAFLETNGDISSCFFPYRIKMGSIKDNKFKDIWNNDNYQELRRNVSKPITGNFCQKCELRSTYLDDYDGPGINIEQFDLTENNKLNYFRI